MFCVGGGSRGVGGGGLGRGADGADVGRCKAGDGGGGLERGGEVGLFDIFRRSYSALRPLAQASRSSLRLTDSSNKTLGSSLLPHAS